MMSKELVHESIVAYREFVNSPLFESSLAAVLAAVRDEDDEKDRRRKPVRRRRTDGGKPDTPMPEPVGSEPQEPQEPESQEPQEERQTGARRGRIPAVFTITETNRHLRNVSDTVRDVYAHMSAKPEGVTLKTIKDELHMPHSTVWLAVDKLRQRGLVREIA